MNWYKFMWLDAIEKVHSVPSIKSNEDKNFGLLVFFAFTQVTNIICIHIILTLLNISFSPFVVTKDYFINFLFLIFIPSIFIVINQIIFFYKKRYVAMLELKEKNKGGRGFMYYVFISYGVFIFLLILYHFLYVNP
jgi:hypothetical protein